MIGLAAARLGYKCHVYAPPGDNPACHIAARNFEYDWQNTEKLTEFAKTVSVITPEFENIPPTVLETLHAVVPLCPAPRILKITQNRIEEKKCFEAIGAPVPEWHRVDKNAQTLRDPKALRDMKLRWHAPFRLKTVRMGYDGKGQRLVHSAVEMRAALRQLGADCIAERQIPLKSEFSVIIARFRNGTSTIFPPAENRHSQGILRSSSVPTRDISSHALRKARNIARRLSEGLDLCGLLAIEFFLDHKGRLYANEMAARPHNSGHWTMDGCQTDQFEQLVRAICGLPAGSVARNCAGITMKNLLGMRAQNEYLRALSKKTVRAHWYGKTTPRPRRKMGHLNFITLS